MATLTPPRSRLARSGLYLALGALVCGCDRPPSRAPAAGPTPAPTARETIAQLIATRNKHQFDDMQALIMPANAQEVIDTLVAVDDLLGANQTLGAALRARGLSGLAQSVDQSYLADNLDIFSPYLELLDEVVTADTATVGFTSDGRLPVKRATLRRVAGTWRYDPGPGYDPRLPQAFHRIAVGLRQMADDVQSGRLSADQLRDQPDSFIERVRVAMLPGVKLLPDSVAPPQR
jgi:hypothetical protein